MTTTAPDPQGISEELNVIQAIHGSTPRDYVGRMTADKAACMRRARKFDFDFWDGDRRYGYGGYRYDGRYAVVAKALAEHFALPPDARILDVGCGKGFLLYEFTRILPQCRVTGTDISEYAVTNGHPGIRDRLRVAGAEDPFPYADKEFDLVVSLNTLHNLPIYHLQKALGEIERVGKNGYIVVESYRNEQELFALQCWALTCEAFFSPEEWRWLFGHFGYSGDYEFIYFGTESA
jgi:ubiquinone/menaquinone biosynthesis C-methylase UbiE